MSRGGKNVAARLLTLVILYGIGQLQSLAYAADWQLVESGYSASVKGSYVWLDKDRMLFSGGENAAPVISKDENGNEKKKYKGGTFIWDTRTNTVTQYPVNMGIHCYRDGYIRYVTFNADGRPGGERRKGQLGQEKVYERWEKDGSPIEYFDDQFPDDPPESDQSLLVSQFSCKPFVGRRDRDVLSLSPQHGYLDWGHVGTRTAVTLDLPLALVRPDGKVIDLPIRRIHVDRVSPSGVRYYEFAGGYLLRGDYAKEYVNNLGIGPRVGDSLVPRDKSPTSGRMAAWPEGAKRTLWLLKPDGSVTEYSLPLLKEWAAQSYRSDYFLTRKGIVVKSANDRGSYFKEYGDMGLYLWDGARSHKLIAGWIGVGAQVSPDGCKIAFVHDDGGPFGKLRQEPEYHVLKLIDFCGEHAK